MNLLSLAVAFIFMTLSLPSLAERSVISKDLMQVESGVLQWTRGDKKGTEVALFGVNYSTPFAYSYRAIEKLGIDHKDAIDMDVDHIARLGLDAYRIHLWDRELSDKDGNLLKNEHLALFDYLLFKLKQRHIKVIITPLSWWGTGYPEPDPTELGFASHYSKSQMNQNEKAIEAQYNYLQQLMVHENSFTGETYADDENIIAFELFNEPEHKQSPEITVEYIEGLIDVIRSSGVTKPLFYNISQQGNNQAYASALCNSNIDGVAYQWYPTGLVKNSKINANMLPVVAKYTDPFASIERCKGKAKMIYEFDAADVESSVMYPAMARSFRSAGFQWATQFAYDPAVIAHTNSEYNTHYLNLLYTPSKAISFMIAAQTFRQLSRGYESSPYPENNNFDDVSLNYSENLSLLNNEQMLYFSNNNQVVPKNISSLKHIAGVGSSNVSSYSGTGAYFIDKINDGVWLLEVYPDVQELEDPYQNSSLKRLARKLFIDEQILTLELPDLGDKFYMKGINEKNSNQAVAKKGSLSLVPGKYLLSKQAVSQLDMNALLSSQGISKNYYLPKISAAEIEVSHQPQRTFSLDDNIKFSANIGSTNNVDKVELLIRYKGHRDFSAITMKAELGNNFVAALPKTEPWSQTGPLEYAIVVHSENNQVTFPGKNRGTPADWDFVTNQPYWQMQLTPQRTSIRLFDALMDKDNLLYPKNGRVNQDYVSGEQGEGAAIRLSLDNIIIDNTTIGNEQNNFLMRTTLSVDNGLKGRNVEGANTLEIKVRALDKSEHITLGLLNKDSLAYSKNIAVEPHWQIMQIPIKELLASDTMMTQGYPTFIPSVFISQNSISFAENNSLKLIQGLQVSMNNSAYKRYEGNASHSIEIEYISLVYR